MKIKSLFLVALVFSSPSQGMTPPETCDRAALQSAGRFGVPPQVMLAITRAETGRNLDGNLSPWPWSVNVAGDSHWFESQAEAAEFVRAELDRGQSNIDLGCFQLNWRWHGENFRSIDQMLSPAQNAEYAAGFLVEQHRKYGNWVDAVAAYHSNDPENAERYIEKVENILMDLSENSTFIEDMPSDDEVTIAANQFPLLQEGQSGSLASLVPTGGLQRPLLIGQ